MGSITKDSLEQGPELDSPTSPELFDSDQPCASCQAEGSELTTPDIQKQKKRKRSKTERMENITAELIDKLVEAQQSSDRCMIELEEKRLKFEERQMDKEAQQRREEREFQLRMMQMMIPPPGMHADPPSSASFAFGTVHESTLARRMHTFPSQVDSDNEE